MTPATYYQLAHLLATAQDAVEMLRNPDLPDWAREVAARRLAVFTRVPDTPEGYAAALLAACACSDPPLPGWGLFDVERWKALAKAVREEHRRGELGPGWARRVKGVEVSDDGLPLAGPEPDALLPLRLNALRDGAPGRERQVLAVLEADPAAKDADLSALLGVKPSTARVLLARLRKRAAGL